MNGKEIFEKIAEYIQYYDREFKKLNITKTDKAYATFILHKLNASKRFQFTTILGYLLITFGDSIKQNPELLKMLTHQYIGFANSNRDKLIGAKSLKMGVILYNLAPSPELLNIFIEETKKQINKFAQTILYELILINGHNSYNGLNKKELDIKPALRTIIAFQQIINGIACRKQINNVVNQELLKLEIANLFLKSIDFVKGEWKNLLNVIYSLHIDLENYFLNNKIEPTDTYYISVKAHCGVHFYGEKLLKIKEQLTNLSMGMENLTENEVLIDDAPYENMTVKSFSLDDLF